MNKRLKKLNKAIRDRRERERTTRFAWQRTSEEIQMSQRLFNALADIYFPDDDDEAECDQLPRRRTPEGMNE